MDQLSKLLQQMITMGASDLFISANRPATFRVLGKIQPTTTSPLSQDKVEQMSRLLMMDEHYEEFQKNPDINIGVSLPHAGRFRVNIFKQRHSIAMVIRTIPSSIPSLTELGLPQVMEKIAMLDNGLVLIVGPAGTGKSSSLASIVKYRAEQELCHVITLEDPIEYIFETGGSIINQREIGVDTTSYHQGLINVLRQSPDVMMIGEVREAAVLEKLLEFSDTGHLCISTLHANGVAQAIDRMLAMFPEERRGRVLTSLAGNLSAIISQRLVPAKNGTQVLAYELHTFTSHTADLIRRGETSKIQDFIQKDTTEMSQTLDDTLFKLFQSDKISEETSIRYALSAGNMKLKIRLSRRPEATPASDTTAENR